MTWQNRIAGHAQVTPQELIDNPLNFRVHGLAQCKAVEALMDEVGWLTYVTVSKRTGVILDGHLRVEIARRRGTWVPVRYVDVDEREERLVLATLDRSAAMAGIEADKLGKLQDLIATENATLAGLLADQFAKATALEVVLSQPREQAPGPREPKQAPAPAGTPGEPQGPGQAPRFVLGKVEGEIAPEVYARWLAELQRVAGGNPDDQAEELLARMGI